MSTTTPKVQGFVIPRPMFNLIAVAGTVLSDMSVLEHLEELRQRILKSLLAVGLAMIACWTYTVELIDFAQNPARRVSGIKLITIDATEIFSLYFQSALLGAICFALPVILWQIWQFISPGLYRHERRYAGPFIISTTLAFIAGAAFAYAVMLPVMLQLIVALAGPIGIEEVTLGVSSYFDMFTWMLLTMGIVFEIPPFIFILSRIGLINARFLARNFKYAILLSVVTGAVVTPSQDVATMLLVAAPIISLYAIGILVAFVFGKSRVVDA
jgi:sec-independent protein translocase protein TatC